jgi:hypothetical protein
MNRWTDEQRTDRQTDGLSRRLCYRQTDGQADRLTDRQMVRQTNRWIKPGVYVTGFIIQKEECCLHNFLFRLNSHV